MLQRFGGGDVGGSDESADDADYVEVAAEFGECAGAGDGFDAADAGGDGAFADELDEADFAGGGGVRAAAELGGEVADLDDADLVAVLFAEERHGVVLVDGDVDGHVDEGLDAGVGEDLAVDDVFDLLQLFVGDAGEVREVEAQAGRVDERAGLLDVRAEDFAQGGVEQVGAGVVALGCSRTCAVDDGVDVVADGDGLRGL